MQRSTPVTYRDLTRGARSYYLGVLAAAAALFIWSLTHTQPERDDVTLAATLAAAGLVTLIVSHGRGMSRREVDRSPRMGVNVDAVWVFAAVLLLPFPLMMLSTVLARCMSLLVRRHPVMGMRTGFNMAVVALSGFVASLAHQWVNGRGDVGMTDGVREVLAVLAAAGVFAVITNLLGGILVTLAKDTDLRRDQVANAFLPEVALLCHGGLVAWAYVASPVMFLLAFPTLVLVQRALMHDELRKAASSDSKTGLLSAGWWRELAEDEISAASAQSGTVGILVVDLDFFKRVNDTYGHLVGDDVLRATAKALRASVRAADKVGRFGGEEFVVLLPGATANATARVAERVRRTIEATAISVQGQPLRVTASVGGAVFPRDGQTLSEILEAADKRVYDAKQAGRNQVRVSAPEPA